MAETFNLRQWKKRQAKSEAEKSAARNRASFGASKAAKQERAAEAKKSAAFLDSHQLLRRDEP